MKRFSKVVRHPHKLTQWSAGIRKKADKDKKKTRVMFCEEQRVTREGMQVNPGSHNNVSHIYQAWMALKKTRNDVETLENLLEVLLGSCVNPCECVQKSVILQGDIRALLSDKKLVCQLLVKLSGHWEKAVTGMVLSSDVCKLLLENKPQSHEEVSVEILRLFGWTAKLGEQEATGQHLSEIMPWLSSQDNLTARIICDDWERLPNGLVGKVLFAFSHPGSLRSWMNVLLTLDAKDGSHLMWILLDRDLDTYIVTDNVAPILSYAFYQKRVLKDDQRVLQFVAYLFKGMTVKRLECLLKLERHTEKRSAAHHSSSEGVDDYDALKPFIEYFTEDQILEAWAGDFISDHWRYAASSMKRHDLNEKERKRFATLMVDQSAYLEGDKQDIRWFIDAAAMSYKSVDEKFHSKLSYLLYFRFNSEESLEKWKLMLKMVLIVCGPKMNAKSCISSLFISLETENVEDLFLKNLQPKAWKNLDDYMRSENRGDIMTDGLDRVLEYDRSLIHTVIRGLNSSPVITLKAISDIGLYPKSDVKSVFQWLEYHPLYGQNGSDISQRCSILNHLSTDHPSVDLPRKMIKIVLNDGGINSLRKEVREKEEAKLEAAEMRMLFTAISDYMSVSLTTVMGSKDVDSHSMAMINTTKRNRRGGRRALKRHSRKGESARLLHPSNILWFKKPNAFWRPAVWIKGVSEELTLVNIGKVTIQTEHRLAEILKMGTYVNSCLSMGGCNQHSAIANALDANKRVLYLHDSEGKFIARQLLAVTKERKLACFMVYHSGHQHDRKMIEYCFARTNKKFAAELGLTIQDESEYEIERVICKDWYDDGIWIHPKDEEAS